MIQLVAICLLYDVVSSLTWMSLSLATWTIIGKVCWADNYQQKLCSPLARHCFLLSCVSSGLIDWHCYWSKCSIY